MSDPAVTNERVEALRRDFNTAEMNRQTDRMTHAADIAEMRKDLRAYRDEIATDRRAADEAFEGFRKDVDKVYADHCEKKFDPLSRKVDGFVNFQKLATALWTALVFIGGLIAGSSGWFRGPAR